MNACFIPKIFFFPKRDQTIRFNKTLNGTTDANAKSSADLDKIFKAQTLEPSSIDRMKDIQRPIVNIKAHTHSDW